MLAVAVVVAVVVGGDIVALVALVAAIVVSFASVIVICYCCFCWINVFQ